MSNPKLKYLFSCQFKDGTILNQNPADCSPSTDGKNCFYDVLNRIADVELFWLENDELRYVVNCIDGNFYICLNRSGNWVQIAHFAFDFGEVMDMRLIYFLRNIIHTAIDTDSGEVLEDGTLHERFPYLGWQANSIKDGSNIRVVMGIG